MNPLPPSTSLPTTPHPTAVAVVIVVFEETAAELGGGGGGGATGDPTVTDLEYEPQIILPYYKVVGFLNRPVLKLTLPQLSMYSDQNTNTDRPSFLTLGDTLFMALAIYLGSTGFSVGYFVGKLTANAVRSVDGLPAGLAELWTVGLAILFDTLYINFI